MEDALEARMKMDEMYDATANEISMHQQLYFGWEVLKNLQMSLATQDDWSHLIYILYAGELYGRALRD